MKTEQSPYRLIATDQSNSLFWLWFRLFMFSYLTSFFFLRMLPGEVNLSLHRKGLSKIKLSKIKKYHKNVF